MSNNKLDFIAASCADDYDPNSMPVEQARRLIRQYLVPVNGVETLPVRAALGRVLAADMLSPCNVPNHDNSAMDGYAFNGNDIAVAAKLKLIGTAYAGKPYNGKVGRGECVRIMTGADRRRKRQFSARNQARPASPFCRRRSETGAARVSRRSFDAACRSGAGSLAGCGRSRGVPSFTCGLLFYWR